MLADYLPPVVSKIREIKEICRVEQPEFDKAREKIEQALLNLFAKTANKEGLARFEKELGIIPREGATLNERRACVLAKDRNRHITYSMALDLARRFDEEIRLVPNYNTADLAVWLGDGTQEVTGIYKALDDEIDLGVFIYFVVSGEEKKIFEERSAELILETKEKIDALRSEKHMLILGNTAKMEVEANTKLTLENDLWYLNGATLLDGSRMLDAEVIKKEI